MGEAVVLSLHAGVIPAQDIVERHIVHGEELAAYRAGPFGRIHCFHDAAPQLEITGAAVWLRTDEQHGLTRLQLPNQQTVPHGGDDLPPVDELFLCLEFGVVHLHDAQRLFIGVLDLLLCRVIFKNVYPQVP